MAVSEVRLRGRRGVGSTDRERGNPASPLAGTYNTPATPGVTVSEVTPMWWIKVGLQIINVANLQAPPSPEARYLWRRVRRSRVGIRLRGGWRVRPQIINVTPRTRTRRDLRYKRQRLSMAVSGSYAYVADESSGLAIINVANPASPRCRIHPDPQRRDERGDLRKLHTWRFLTQGYRSSTSNPSSPALVGT